ncbi:hypothetical protein [Acaryochloris sp. IP29b_bin.137]|uniref:hypothetical protein n=1 Tax=Acaryochloris sp. IP29b_bin.137 TaxID=2969217 RepID=UPI00263490FE|nr:hypothetical protein [Acaryochloris sp. IP29b_bin.137]
MNNIELLKVFVSSYLSGYPALESNAALRFEPIGDTLQLLAKTEGLVATAKLSGDQRYSSIRYKSIFWSQLHKAMVLQKCLPVRQSKISGFYEYEPIDIPRNYSVHFTNTLDLLQAWWKYERENRQRSLMSLLILYRGTLYPIQNLVCERGTITIQISGHRMRLNPLNMVSWLQSIEQPALSLSSKPKKQFNETQTKKRLNRSKPSPSVHRRTDVSHYPGNKRIGSYLVDAGLLSLAQVEVVLSDQDLTEMRFGEILVSRGWLKFETVEFVFQNVILPQRTLAKKTVDATNSSQRSSQRYRQERLNKVANKVEEPSLPKRKVLPLTSGKKSMPTPGKLPVLQLPSIHEHETIPTYDNLNSEYLPDWIEGMV